jgi:predicted PurR-regulated permease PerM
MKQFPPHWRLIFTIAAVCLLLVLLFSIRLILVYGLIALIISLICDPLSDLLRKIEIGKRRIPSALRALIALTAFVSVLISIGALFAPLIATEVQFISHLDPQIISRELDLRLIQLREENGFLMPLIPAEGTSARISSLLGEMINFSRTEELFTSLFGAIASFSVAVFSIFFMSFFLIKDGMLFSRMVITITPQKHLDKMKKILQHSYTLLRRYFIGLAAQSFIMTTMVTTGMWIAGVPNALLIGIFAGIMNVVPYLGPLISLAFSLFIGVTSVLQQPEWTALTPVVLSVVIVFMCAQLMDAFVVQPFVLGNSVKAHPLEIYVVILIAGIWGGPLAMMVAIPAYTIIRVIAREFLYNFKVVSTLTREL